MITILSTFTFGPFNFRYGECHPVFYIGTLEDAIKDALHVRTKDVSKKPMSSTKFLTVSKTVKV